MAAAIMMPAMWPRSLLAVLLASIAVGGAPRGAAAAVVSQTREPRSPARGGNDLGAAFLQTVQSVGQARPGRVLQPTAADEAGETAAASAPRTPAEALADLAIGRGHAPDGSAPTKPGHPAQHIHQYSGMFDIEHMKMVQFGIALYVMAVVAFVGALAFEYLCHRSDAGPAGKSLVADAGGGDDDVHEQRLLRILTGVLPLVRPYFGSSAKAPFYLWAIVFLGLWDLVLGLIFAVWMKEFWDIIQHKQGDRFMPVMRFFLFILFTWIVVATYKAYISMMLIIDWRRWMTHWLMQHWLQHKTYYQMQLRAAATTPDNPDQRLQEDIKIFTQTVVELTEGALGAGGRMLSMVPLLLLLSPAKAFGIWYCPGWLLGVAVLYSGLGTAAAHWIGSKLIVVNFRLQRYEADFRYQVVQVRDHAESIALYGSEECEQRRLHHQFERIATVWWSYMLYTKRLGFFTTFYHHSSTTFPYLVLAPNYFKGEITLGTMFMLFNALGAVKGGFDWIINSYAGLTAFRATSDRLLQFKAAMDRPEGKTIDVVRSSLAGDAAYALIARDISVRLPDSSGGRTVWKGASLSVARGQFVLLSAPEGSGKSCFFRALAGIWPHASGSVEMPAASLFVPQKSHIPQGSLKQAVTYPDGEEAFTDQEVLNVLELVGLSKAITGQSLWTAANWALVLSGGEAQRLAIAHAVLRRPQVLFLDEATSALGEQGALDVYALLRKPGILPEGAAVVSVSHDVSLLSRIHDVHYNLNASNWVQK